MGAVVGFKEEDRRPPIEEVVRLARSSLVCRAESHYSACPCTHHTKAREG